MSLLRSTRLGPYEVLEPLGKGGMGEVYRGVDTRLKRCVAIKILPEPLAADPDRVQRFRHESQILASLNHPNIVTIFDVGVQEDLLYVVMEFLEGQTLRPAGKLPARTAIEYARQIADGLGAAHARGILHRDLKPENVMISKDGRVKLLDFGLAKQRFERTSTDTATETVTARSAPGVVVGTTGYVSPEQIRGEPADTRSDIFGFGCTFYEMLAGRRAFIGGSGMEILGSILRDEPADIPDLPPAVHRLLHRCLEKDPERRFQSAADLSFALSQLAETPSGAMVVQPPSRRAVLVPLVAVPSAAACVAGGYFIHARLRRPEPPRFRRLTFRPGAIRMAQFASGGSNIVYEAAWEDGTHGAYLMTVATGETRDLQLPADAWLASFSSKGEAALLLPSPYRQGYLLARRAVGGGPPRELLDGVRDADWGPDGESLAVIARRPGRKESIEFPIGNVLYETILPSSAFGRAILAIRVSGDGKSVAFAEAEAGPGVRLRIVDRARRVRDVAVLADRAYAAQPLAWSSTGQEIWCTSYATAEAGTVVALRRNGDRRVVARFPSPVTLMDVSSAGEALITATSSRTGIAFVSGNVTRDLSWLDRAWLRYLSPDGSMIIFNEIGEAGGKDGTVYLRKTDGSPPVRLADGTAIVVSQDAKWVTVARQGDGTLRHRLVPVGAGETQDLEIRGFEQAIITAWLTGDRLLLFGNEPGKADRYFVWSRTSGARAPLTPEGTHNRGPTLTPDCRYLLAFHPSSKWRLYPVDGGEPRPARGLKENDYPVTWSESGRLVFVAPFAGYRLPVYSVDVTSGARTLWREISGSTPTTRITMLRMAPDGRSFAYQYTRTSSDLYSVEGWAGG